MGIHQLKKAWRFQQHRQAMAERYHRELSGLPLLRPPVALAGDTHAWHLYVIRLNGDAAIGRDAFIEAMAQRGIGCSVHFIPLHLQPYWRDTYKLEPEDFPHALQAYRQAVSLPLYTRMSDDDQSKVIAAIRDILSV